MCQLKRISNVFYNSEYIPFDNNSKIVLMSDCHRGDGSWADNFSPNQNIYFTALQHYYNEDYTYIELGDGDELWENKYIEDILENHSHVFWLLSKFHQENRLYIIYGNHDMVKRDEEYLEDYLYYFFDQRLGRYFPLFKDIRVHEGLILQHTKPGIKLHLIHGHQADFSNDRLWRMNRYLVRNFWRPLNAAGIKDPTSTAKNYQKKESVDLRLVEWASRENKLLIAGHTHRPVFPSPGQSLYFNDGSCVHPRCITAIEIFGGNIQLVKWSTRTNESGCLCIGKDILAGPQRIIDYFPWIIRREEQAS